MSDPKRYVIECEVTRGPAKGKVWIVGNPDTKMTHAEAVKFRDAHASFPWRMLHLKEVQP